MGKSNPPRLLIVGSFRKGHDGLTGGTYAACMQLLGSGFANVFALTQIDISQVSPRSRSITHRLPAGMARVLQVLWLVLTRRLDAALIFATVGFSLIERTLMALICRLGSVPVFLFPRADVIADITRPGPARSLTRRAVGYGVRYIFQGESLRRGFVAQIPGAANLSFVIGNWISLDWFETIAPAKPSQTVTALYAGWVNMEKGLDVLLQALALRADSLGNLQLVICGDGTGRVELQRQAAAQALPVEFRGWVHGEAKHKTFSQADLIVLPSLTEGMPNLLLEAMAASRPVIASDVGCIGDLVESGVEGILVPAGDSQRLADALVSLASDQDLRLRMGRAGRARIERAHNTERSWRVLAGLINDEIRRSGGRAVSADGLG